MARRTYTAEQKAEALAAILVGESVYGVATRLDVPYSTVHSWQLELQADQNQTVLQQEKREELGELVTEYVRESLRTLRIQARQFATTAWLERQNAADAAVLHGVMADKTIRVLSAIHE